ncbi:MAG: twin-arginine translocation signal domain-containing protein, partial [Anaerovibrio sp.]|nr:twin-arginine translocation signal domain-containing protein [Anaerovibrio sp.]
MKRREFIKAIGVGAVGLAVGSFVLPTEGKGMAKKIEIKAVKLYKDGFMTQPFAMGLEDGEEKFDKSVKYRSTLQNFLI